MPPRLQVFMDSKLVVEQMSGRWKVKHPGLIELHAQARKLAARFDRISYAWIPRERNKHADRLANEAMDAAAEISDETPSRAVAATGRATEPAKAVAMQSLSPPGWTGARGTPTRLLLLRHGQTALSVHRRYSGRGNPELTDLGRQQASGGGGIWRERGGIAAVVSSPLQRAYDTAAAAAKALGLDVTVDDDLIETDFGAWEGLTFAEAAERDPDITCAAGYAIPPPSRRAARASMHVLDRVLPGAGTNHRHLPRRHGACGIARHADQDVVAAGAGRRARASCTNCILTWHR